MKSKVSEFVEFPKCIWKPSLELLLLKPISNDVKSYGVQSSSSSSNLNDLS